MSIALNCNLLIQVFGILCSAVLDLQARSLMINCNSNDISNILGTSTYRLLSAPTSDIPLAMYAVHDVVT